MALLGDIVKVVLVRIRTDGAAQAKAQMASIAEQARAISKMDPTIKVKVDRDAALQLRAMRIQLDALKLAGDSAGLRNLAAGLRAIGSSADSPVVRLRALRLAIEALNAGGTGGGAAIPAGVPGLGGMSVPAAIAAVIAGLAALPFLAQAAAGAITFGLGAALTGIGIYAAKNTRSVQYQFGVLSANAQKDFQNLSPAFGVALTEILRTARAVLPGIAKTFTEALKPIAGPFEAFGQTLIRVFADPQVAASIRAVGQAFGGILKALTPQLAGDAAAIADGITNIARAIAKNPKPIADFISALAHLVGVALDVIAWLTQIADYLEIHFIGAWRRSVHQVAHFLADMRHDFAHWYDDVRHLFDHATQTVMTWAHDVVRWLDDARHRAAVIFDGMRHEIAHIWDMIWNNTIGRIERGVGDAVRWFRGLPGKVMSALSALPGLLFRAGVNAVQHLISGLMSQLGNLASAAGSIVSKIAGFFGLSPAREGPLSGSGSMQIRGQHAALDFARGMSMGTASVGAAAGLMARAAIPGAYGAGYGGGIQVVISPAQGADPALQALVRLVWPMLRAEVRTRGGGGPNSVQKALGVEFH